MAERFLPLYPMALGGTAWAIGAFNGLNSPLGALYSLPGGWLNDRLDCKRALVRDTVASIAAFGSARPWNVSPAADFLTAAALGLAGTLWFGVCGRDAPPGRHPPAPPPGGAASAGCPAGPR